VFELAEYALDQIALDVGEFGKGRRPLAVGVSPGHAAWLLLLDGRPTLIGITMVVSQDIVRTPHR
jgi:hypothetical protein